MAFLVGPGGDLNTEPGAIRVGGEGTGEFQPVDHAQGAVEPAAIRLSLEMRPDQQPPLRQRLAADYITDAVDRCVEPGLAQLPGEPMPRLDINRRIGRAVDTSLVAPEFGEPPEVSHHALPVDDRHVVLP